MTKNLPFEVDDELLVAYLDGELPDDEAALVDQSLASDDSLRKRLSNLRITWDLLGELPDVQPQRDLTQTTIAMVALAVKQEKNAIWPAWLPTNLWLWFAIAAVITFSSGVWLASSRAAAQTAQMLNDLPILDRYVQVVQIESVAWLDKLASVDNLVQAVNNKPDAADPNPLPNSHPDRLDWLQQITPSRKLKLAANLKSLELETPQRRAEFRKIGSLLTEGSSQHSALDYQNVMSAYANILDRVGTTEQLKLRAIDDLAQRADEVNRLVHREMAMAYAKKLSAEDRAAIRSWNYTLQNTWDIFSRSLNPDTQVVLEVYKDASESFITNEDLQLLEAELSDTALELLAGLDKRQQRDVLGLWLLHVVEPSKASTHVPTGEELLKRFNGLTTDTQTSIEFLSERDARSLVSQLTTPTDE